MQTSHLHVLQKPATTVTILLSYWPYSEVVEDSEIVGAYYSHSQLILQHGKGKSTPWSAAYSVFVPCGLIKLGDTLLCISYVMPHKAWKRKRGSLLQESSFMELLITWAIFSIHTSVKLSCGKWKCSSSSNYSWEAKVTWLQSFSSGVLMFCIIWYAL